jgi:cytochrome c oxidase assembly factor CtaG
MVQQLQAASVPLGAAGRPLEVTATLSSNFYNSINSPWRLSLPACQSIASAVAVSG